MNTSINRSRMLHRSYKPITNIFQITFYEIIFYQAFNYSNLNCSLMENGMR